MITNFHANEVEKEKFLEGEEFPYFLIYERPMNWIHSGTFYNKEDLIYFANYLIEKIDSESEVETTTPLVKDVQSAHEYLTDLDYEFYVFSSQELAEEIDSAFFSAYGSFMTMYELEEKIKHLNPSISLVV